MVVIHLGVPRRERIAPWPPAPDRVDQSLIWQTRSPGQTTDRTTVPSTTAPAPSPTRRPMPSDWPQVVGGRAAVDMPSSSTTRSTRPPRAGPARTPRRARPGWAPRSWTDHQGSSAAPTYRSSPKSPRAGSRRQSRRGRSRSQPASSRRRPVAAPATTRRRWSAVRRRRRPSRAAGRGRPPCRVPRPARPRRARPGRTGDQQLLAWWCTLTAARRVRAPGPAPSRRAGGCRPCTAPSDVPRSAAAAGSPPRRPAPHRRLGRTTAVTLSRPGLPESPAAVFFRGMPAVTVDDILALPRVPAPALDAVDRPVASVTTAPRGFEGEGFPVRRAFAGVDLPPSTRSSTWTRWARSSTRPGEPKGTPWHPHRGFETVTYMIDGEMAHQDSNGGGGLITNGDTQWMTAGSGILHIETPPEHLVASGGLFHGFQLWVNLPSDAEVRRAALPGHPRRQGVAALLRRRRRAAARDRRRGRRPRRARLTYTPITLVARHARPARRSPCRGGRTSTRWSTCWAAPARSAPSGGRSRSGQLAVFGAGDIAHLRAADAQDSRTPDLDVLILGGRPIREPVVAYGPFVNATRSSARRTSRPSTTPSSTARSATARSTTWAT